MPRTYLPAREGELLAWSQNFLNQIETDFADYGLTLEQQGAYEVAQEAFASAYQTVNNPMTRSPGNIEAKNTAKKALIELTRDLVNICQAYPGIDNDKRAALQITIPESGTTPVPVPGTMPRITLLPSSGLTVHFKVNDVDETRRGRPPEAAAALVYTYVGASAPTDIKQWQFQGPTTKAKTSVTFPTDTPGGSTVWFTAVWVNGKMQPGPASLPISTNVAGGGVSMAA